MAKNNSFHFQKYPSLVRTNTDSIQQILDFIIKSYTMREQMYKPSTALDKFPVFQRLHSWCWKRKKICGSLRLVMRHWVELASVMCSSNMHCPALQDQTLVLLTPSPPNVTFSQWLQMCVHCSTPHINSIIILLMSCLNLPGMH